MESGKGFPVPRRNNSIPRQNITPKLLWHGNEDPTPNHNPNQRIITLPLLLLLFGGGLLNSIMPFQVFAPGTHLKPGLDGYLGKSLTWHRESLYYK